MMKPSAIDAMARTEASAPDAKIEETPPSSVSSVISSAFRVTIYSYLSQKETSFREADVRLKEEQIRKTLVYSH